jgi:hypothetical protein
MIRIRIRAQTSASGSSPDPTGSRSGLATLGFAVSGMDRSKDLQRDSSVENGTNQIKTIQHCSKINGK